MLLIKYVLDFLSNKETWGRVRYNTVHLYSTLPYAAHTARFFFMAGFWWLVVGGWSVFLTNHTHHLCMLFVGCGITRHYNKNAPQSIGKQQVSSIKSHVRWWVTCLQYRNQKIPKDTERTKDTYPSQVTHLRPRVRACFLRYLRRYIFFKPTYNHVSSYMWPFFKEVTRHSTKKRRSTMAHGQNSTVALCSWLSLFVSSWLLRLSSGSIKSPALPQQTLITLLLERGGAIFKNATF